MLPILIYKHFGSFHNLLPPSTDSTCIYLISGNILSHCIEAPCVCVLYLINLTLSFYFPSFLVVTRWQSMYVPVLTSAMVGLVEAPGYFVMGCHRDYLSIINAVEGLVIVDIDRGTLVSKSDEWIQELPLKATSGFCTKVCNPCWFEFAAVALLSIYALIQIMCQ